MSLPQQVALPRPQEPARRPRVTPRPAPKKRRSYGRVILVGITWAALISSAFLLVERQTEIQRELQTMTDLAAEEAILDQQNLEAAGRLVQGTSVAEIEAWAQAHGMVKATAVKPLEADPSAVAARPVTLSEVASAPQESGFIASARMLLDALFTPLSAKGQ